MGQLTDFLMKDYEQTAVQREVMISPFPFPFVLRSITQEENKELEKSCEKKKFNPKTKQTEVETDRNLYVSRLLRGAELQKHRSAGQIRRNGCRGSGGKTAHPGSVFQSHVCSAGAQRL